MQLTHIPDDLLPAESDLLPTSDVEDSKMLDLVFLMDSTGSMGSYIESAKRNIGKIAAEIQQSEKISAQDLRMCLIAYRDHPPQDKTYVLRQFPFTSDPLNIRADLANTRASGGGDGPEAVTAAMNAALNLKWRPNATKIIVLIADAPPHGLGESDDGFPNGDPDGLDPLIIARLMAQKGIVIYPVACEPTLSTSYTHATDFFNSLAVITGGLMVPLTSATLLTQAIVGGAQEQMDLEQLIKELGHDAADKVAAGRSEEEVTEEMYRELEGRGVQTWQLNVGDVYTESEEAKYNVDVWTSSPNLTDAKGKVKRVSMPRLRNGYDAFAGRRYKGKAGGVVPRRKVMKRHVVTLGDDEEDDDEEDEEESKVQDMTARKKSVSVGQAQRIVKQSLSRRWGE